MFADDIITDAQAQTHACPRRFGGKKRIKNFGNIFRGYPASRVCDIHTNIFVFGVCLNRDRPFTFNGLGGIDQ